MKEHIVSLIRPTIFRGNPLRFVNMEMPVSRIAWILYDVRGYHAAFHICGGAGEG